MDQITTHAGDRIDTRIADAGIDPLKVRQAANFIAPKCQGATAILLVTLPAVHGVAWSGSSNGDQVWAIVRQGRVVTVMLRRSTQPTTPKSLRVSVVITDPSVFC